MQQILFRLPILEWPIYGYGFMLFLAFFFCTWLAARLAKQQGIPTEKMQDVGIWIFVCGILGARITFMIQYKISFGEFYKIWEGLDFVGLVLGCAVGFALAYFAIGKNRNTPRARITVGIGMVVGGLLGGRIAYLSENVPLDLWFGDLYKIWDGGLVFYGSAIGGVVGYFGAYFTILKKYNISTWKMADVIAPCGALGLCLGRIGCLLNGCCYGNVACPDCWSVSFPMPAEPRYKMVSRGYQTTAGFTLAEGTVVGKVEPNSPAYAAGLRDGDLILQVNGHVDERLETFNSHNWPKSKNDLTLTVRHKDGGQPVDLGPFKPRSIGLHPTQLFESISMALLCLLMLAYMPFRRRDGEVMVLFMLCYAVHRFLNEMLRTDTDKVAFDMTLSQNISILVFASGLVLALILWRRPVQYGRSPVPALVVADGAFQRVELAKTSSNKVKPRS
jgi:phosphatidylglycerol:prolipoprotein diacylglycerol transferase